GLIQGTTVTCIDTESKLTYDGIVETTGSFHVPNVPAGSKYQLVADRMHYVVTPSEHQISTLVADSDGHDFSMALMDYAISAAFRDPFVRGEGEGVQVTITSNNDTIARLATSKDGTFSFSAKALESYELRFEKQGFKFTPDSPVLLGPLLTDRSETVECRSTEWGEKAERLPRLPRWYDALPRPTDRVTWDLWSIARHIASGHGSHSADHLPGLIDAVGRGPFDRTNILTRIVAYAMQNGVVVDQEKDVSKRYRIDRLPSPEGDIVLDWPIIVIHNYVANPLYKSPGTVFARGR
ncbi:MAG: carboxypeptidase-like regulatory domain-containing protein, partial [Deltaproteobacteria bacterium]|nr:carboxypeptidase-like regulatory domain-containing protein [Deltaproteobacteria bacterium]